MAKVTRDSMLSCATELVGFAEIHKHKPLWLAGVTEYGRTLITVFSSSPAGVCLPLEGVLIFDHQHWGSWPLARLDVSGGL